MIEALIYSKLSKLEQAPIKNTTFITDFGLEHFQVPSFKMYTASMLTCDAPLKIPLRLGLWWGGVKWMRFLSSETTRFLKSVNEN